MTDQAIDLYAQVSDAELVSRILAGEKELYAIIVRRYNQRLYRIGMSVLNNESETEDAMQNSYINAYQHLQAFEHRSSLGTWLVRIMINECLAQKKKKQAAGYPVEKTIENNPVMTTPANILVNKELSSVLEDAIARLPEKYRLVFVLREVEELSVRETGQALQIAEVNVKVRLNRAKTMLRTELSGYMKDHVYAFHLSRCDKMVNTVLARLHLVRPAEDGAA